MSQVDDLEAALNDPQSQAPPLRRQTSVRFNDLQRSGSIRSVGNYRDSLAERRERIEQRRQREAGLDYAPDPE